MNDNIDKMPIWLSREIEQFKNTLKKNDENYTARWPALHK